MCLPTKSNHSFQCWSQYFQSAQKIFGGNVKTHILLFTDNVDKEHEHMVAYKAAAGQFKGKVSEQTKERSFKLLASQDTGIVFKMILLQSVRL